MSHPVRFPGHSCLSSTIALGGGPKPFDNPDTPQPVDTQRDDDMIKEPPERGPMDSTTPSEITQMLTAWRDGDPQALANLTPLVYGELHGLAQVYLASERPGHILQPSALVNEAFLRLMEWKPQQWQNRAHFFGVCATMMRRILVNCARDNQTLKRGAGALRVSLSEANDLAAQPVDGTALLALDIALEALEKLSPRQARTIELRFFGGLSLEDTAEVMGNSVSTVRRDFRMAQAWLYQQLRDSSA